MSITFYGLAGVARQRSKIKYRKKNIAKWKIFITSEIGKVAT
jgi:hypothetical protein